MFDTVQLMTARDVLVWVWIAALVVMLGTLIFRRK
jgi:hypothetical protein